MRGDGMLASQRREKLEDLQGRRGWRECVERRRRRREKAGGNG
jgi:hypothetical protein